MCNVINAILFELAGTTADSLPHSSTCSTSMCRLNLVLTNNAELSEVLPELSVEQTETVRNDMSILNGLYIEHLWFTEQEQNILYHGHIISAKSTGKVPKATICYWTQEDIEEEGEDEKICILQLLTDYITGDMIFVDFPDM